MEAGSGTHGMHAEGSEASGPPLAIVGARLVPVDGPPRADATLVALDGRIAAIGGRDVPIPDGATVIEAGGRWLLPGFIDAHTHLGVHEEGEGWAGQDVNETTAAVTAIVRALDAINPADQGFRDALAGGVLVANVNPGSANAIGGQTVALRCAGRTVDEMVLRHPSGMKSALGENPKRVHGEAKRMPATRLGTAAVIRKALNDARNYLRKQAEAPEGSSVDVDLELEALGMVLRREIPWRQHCHRADDIATAMRIAEEFGYDLVVDHGTEAHLLADILAARDIPVIIGPLFTSRSKVELRQRSLANPGILARAGVRIALTTDHPVVPINFLVHQATLSMKEGLDPETALASLTANPARILGLDHRLGTLSAGKDATMALWSGDPLDVMERVEMAFIDGREVYRHPHAG
jgi:imidazolonepropionase-like amidohydrolase